MAWIERKELKIYLIAVGAAAVLAFLITTAVLLPGYLKYTRLKKAETAIPRVEVDPSRLLVPEKYKSLRSDSWAPYRQKKDRWTTEEGDEFWKDPETLILRHLGEQNEKLVNDLFKDIP